MLPEDEYFYTHNDEEIWQRYCGFLDLSMDQFMAIQERLLTEQIQLVHGSLLGRKIIGERKPESVREFRDSVPLTTYEDYEPYLTEQREDALAEKPFLWMHTSGRSGRFKWIPWTTRALDVSARWRPLHKSDRHLDRLVVSEDMAGRETEFGSTKVLGDESHDEDGTVGQGNADQDGIPTLDVAGVQAVVALGCGEEPLDDRADRVTQTIPDEVAD